jgi:hypothetical protein
LKEQPGGKEEAILASLASLSKYGKKWIEIEAGKWYFYMKSFIPLFLSQAFCIIRICLDIKNALLTLSLVVLYYFNLFSLFFNVHEM